MRLLSLAALDSQGFFGTRCQSPVRLGTKGFPAEALGRAGSYRTLDNGLEIKEVVVGGDSEARRRFVEFTAGGVVELARNGWTISAGIGGRLRPERVHGLDGIVIIHGRPAGSVLVPRIEDPS